MCCIFKRKDKQKEILDAIQDSKEIIMAAIDSLTQAVADLQAEDAALKTAVGTTITNLEAQVAALQAQLANIPNTDPAIQAAADAIEAEVANLKTIVPVPAA